MALALRVQLSQRDVARFRKALKRIDPKANPQILRRILLKAGFRLQKYASTRYMSGPRPKHIDAISNRLRGSVAVDQGRLPRSISVGTNVKYGATHEFGAVITIRARKKPYLHFKIGDRWVRKKQVTVRIPKRPFLQPALDDVAKELPDIIEREWGKEFPSRAF